MSQMYLASEWQVDARQIPALRQLHDLVTELHGDFRYLSDIFFHEKKLFIDTILVNIASTEYDQLIEQAAQFDFLSWRESKPDEFNSDLAFDPYILSSYAQRTWRARLVMAHQHNHFLV